VTDSNVTNMFDKFEQRVDPKTLSLGRTAVVTENGEDIDIVHIFGEIDLVSAPELGAAIDAAAGSGGPIIVDFSECRYLDSTTFTVLARAQKALGDRIRVVVPERLAIRRLFSITNFDSVVRIEENGRSRKPLIRFRLVDNIT